MSAATETQEVWIDVAKDFARTPGGRYKNESKYSGEEFREKFLEPPLKEGRAIAVDLDGAVGFTTSFLEEAFGGLIRTFGKSVLDRVRIVAAARPNRARKAIEYMHRAIDAAR